jgi:hypothetical protein
MSEEGFGALLRELVGLLGTLGIPYMVVGSFASSVHGEPRTTLDLDLVIDPTGPKLESLLQQLPADRYYVDAEAARDARKHRSMFNVIHLPSGWKLDLIIQRGRPFSVEELRRREKKTLRGVDVDMATAEDTVIAKLEWSKAGNSERQLSDAAAILRLRGPALDIAYIERWVDELELREQWARAQAL